MITMKFLRTTTQFTQHRFAVKYTYSFIRSIGLESAASTCGHGCAHSLYEQIPKLDARAGVMILQSDMTLQRSSLVVGQMTYKLTVQPHLDVWAFG